MDKRTWAEVDLDAIAHNIKEIRKITNPNAKIMAVVKADAYGHGFLEVAKTLLENGADRLAVAVLQEGKQLRSRGVTVPILILGASGGKRRSGTSCECGGKNGHVRNCRSARIS